MLVCCGIAACLSTGAAAADPAPAILKNAARAAGARVLLGDLFENAGTHATDEVASSPPPGASMVLGAAWLASTATAHGLVWQPPSPLTTIKVERVATEIDTPQIAARIAAALGLTRQDQSVALDTTLKLYAPTSGTPSIGVEHLDFDRTTERFTAEIRVPADDPTAITTRVAGRVQTMVAVSVPTRNLMPGDVIARGDVTVTWIRSELAPSAGVADLQQLVGRTPRHPLRVDQPIRTGDIEVPVTVKRNDLVLMVMQQPGMSLTAQGKALDDGGNGSTIRVTNLQSSRVIQAVVIGPGQVAVPSPFVQPAAY
jgi:flagella basal body P-ring formation protein FlgA